MRIGIDLGGTKVEVVALGDDGDELHRERRPTPKDDYQGTVQAIVDLVRAAEQAAGEVGTVGVGIPGTVSPATGLVKNANSTWLIGQPLREDLGAALGREVRVANDANCLAVSEATDGAGAGARLVFAVVVGTGCGGGIAVDGQVHAGANGIAGEWGHNPLPWPDEADQALAEARPCYCGRRGCIELYLSGTGFAFDHQHVTGEARTGAEVAAAAAAGDAGARATLARYQRRMAKALGGLMNLLDPDVVVLGGGMSQVAALYDAVPELLPEWCFGGEGSVVLRPAKHGDSSGVRGAAWLWPRQQS